MDLQKVILPGFSPKLPHSFDERATLNITDSATKFDNAYIWFLVGVIYRYLRNPLDPVLDSVCKMRHNLHCLSKVGPTAFPVDDVLVDFSGGNVVFSRLF